MSRFLVLLFSGVIAGGAITGATGTAQAQVYIDGGVAEVYVGDAVQVYVGDGWYAATVLQVSGGSVLVRYFDGSADEWVDVSRLSLSGGGQGVGYQPAIQVYWGSQWYDGTLLATRGNRYHVRYRGVSEWVGADRWHHRGGSNRRPSMGRHDGGRHGYVGGGRRDGGNVRGDRHRGGNVRGNRHGGGGDSHGQVRGGSRGGGRDQGRRNGGGRHQGGGNGRRGGGGRH